MDLLKPIQLLEELIFGIFSIIIFWPKTLWYIISRPARTIELVNEYVEKDVPEGFRTIMSPGLFALIAVVLPVFLLTKAVPGFSAIELFFGWLDYEKSAVAIKSAFAVNLLVALFFLIPPFLFASILLMTGKEEVNKQSLLKNYWHQCLLITPTNLFLFTLVPEPC